LHPVPAHTALPETFLKPGFLTVGKGGGIKMNFFKFTGIYSITATDTPTTERR
jgi:hypothetical protein